VRHLKIGYRYNFVRYLFFTGDTACGVCTNSVADWYRFLSKTLSSALKTMFTQRCRDAMTVTWKTRHFRRFTTRQNKVSKSEGVEKVAPIADF